MESTLAVKVAHVLHSLTEQLLVEVNPDSVVALPVGFLNDLARASDEDTVVEVATRWLSDIIAADRASLALMGDDPASLSIFAVGHDLIITRGAQLPIGDSIVGQVYSQKRTTNVRDLRRLRYRDAQMLAEAGLKSALVAPLLASDQCLGTLNIGSAKLDFFGPTEEKLLSSVATLVAAFMGIHQQVRMEHVRARTDKLTGQLNRLAILEVLDRELDDTAGDRPSVLYIDMDGFKAINDGHGHHVGDEVLRKTVDRIRTILGASQPLGRLGGDEFLVVVGSDPNAEQARRLAHEIIATCRRPQKIGRAIIEPRLSIGIATAHHSPISADALLVEADQAMYVAKNSGKLVVVADDSIRARAELLGCIDRDLDEAMSNGSIGFYYQPIYDISTGRLQGAEALVRWRHPVHGAVPPPLLIERVEVTGKTEVFTKWCINRVASQWQQIRSAIPDCGHLAVSINLTARQLQWPNYADAHLDMLARHSLRPEDVIVEVVESDQISAGDAAEATLRRLAAHDVVIALDDFGTGHNALRYFSMFPIHEIKFDRSLISTILTDPPVRAIVEGLAHVAHRLNIRSLGEGIETADELAVCKDLGLESGQGYFLGRPMPFADFELLAFTAAAEQQPAPVDQSRAGGTDSRA